MGCKGSYCAFFNNQFDPLQVQMTGLKHEVKWQLSGLFWAITMLLFSEVYSKVAVVFSRVFALSVEN